MNHKKPITTLVIIITILSLTAATYGIFSGGGPGQYAFKSLHGETVQIYGKGLYQNDSVSIVSQGIAQDAVTIIVGIPLLMLSLNLYRKGLLKGKLLLAGTLGYFLYTYTSYSFLSMYNSMFLIYVTLMSCGFFAFTLTMMSFDLEQLGACFNKKMPVKFLSGFLFLLAGILGLMWLGIIIPPLLKGAAPAALEHYTTLVIQALDLGFVVPTAILAGVLVIKRKPFGYLLSSVMIVKGLSMGTALTAMIIGQILAGIKVPLAVAVIFPVFNLVFVYCLFLVMRNIQEPGCGLGKKVGMASL